MSMPTQEQFYFEMGEADEKLKVDLYRRLLEIEKGIIEKKVAASNTDHVCDFQALSKYLDGVVLHAPRYPVFDDNNEFFGEISLPDNLQVFLQNFCLGSTRIAYQILKECIAIVRKSHIREVVELMHELQPIVNFIDIIDRVYFFHIGNNPKYSNRKPRTAQEKQWKDLDIFPVSGSTEKVFKSRFLLCFQKKFDNEPLPMAAYSLGTMLEGYCQYCHRPNIARKRYCSIHAPDEKGNNSKGNSITNVVKKSFRNLGLLLHDEEGFIQSHPEEYIKFAEERRNAEAAENDRLRIVQNDIKSEYFIRLEGWAKHNPVYLNFLDKISDVCFEYNEHLGSIEWEDEAVLELISKIQDICRGETYIAPKYIGVDVSSLPPEKIKSTLLGKYGLDIEPKFHPNIEIDRWITMLCRHFQFQLVAACKNEKVAKDLGYII